MTAMLTSFWRIERIILYMTYVNEIEKYLQQDTNRKPTIMTSVDEVTFVIKPTEETLGEYPQHWSQIASELAEIISEKLSLPIIFFFF